MSTRTARPLNFAVFRYALTVDWLVTRVGTGLVAGVVAGAAMPLVAMLIAVATGESVWAPPRAIAGMFFGGAHAGREFALVLVAAGTLVHLLLSALFGVMYGLVTGIGRRRSLATPGQLVTGMGWGLGRWASNTLAIAPHLPGGELMTGAMAGWAWFAMHVIYGALLGVLYARWQPHLVALRQGRILRLPIWLNLDALRTIGGALATETGLLAAGWLLAAVISPDASFGFAVLIIAGGLIAMRYGVQEHVSWTLTGGLWAVLGGMILLGWNSLIALQHFGTLPGSSNVWCPNAC